MSGQPLKSPSDASKYRQQYMATLALQANINDANLQANKIYKRTGQTPTQPTDMRLTSEKLADIERLKIEVRAKLGDIMDGPNAEEVAYDLSPDALQFLAQNIDAIVKEVKPRYQVGIPAQAFITFLNSYMIKSSRINEVAFGLQQAAGGDVMMGAEQIRDIVDGDVLDRLGDAIGSNTVEPSLQRQLSQKIEIFRREIFPLIEDLTNLGQIDDVETRHIIQEYMTSIVNSLPTQNIIITELIRLENAVERQDRRQAELYGQRITQLLTIETSARNIAKSLMRFIRGDIEEVQELGGGEGPVERPSTSTKRPRIAEVDKSTLIQQFEEKYGPIERLGRGDLKKLSTDTLNRDIFPALFQIEGYPRTYKAKDYFETVMGEARFGGKKLGKGELTQVLEHLKENIISYKEGGKSVLADLPTSDRPPFYTSTPSSGSTIPYSGKTLFPSDAPASVKQGKGIKGRPSITPVIDYTQGVAPVAHYIPFGKLFIDSQKLSRGIISVRKGKGAYLTSMRVRRVSPNLNDIIKTVSGGGSPTYAQLSKLDEDESRYLYDLGKVSSLSERIGIPAPTKEDDDRDINQFEIMKGEIASGNDSVELVKKFKALIIKMITKGLLPKGQGKAIILDLVELGY